MDSLQSTCLALLFSTQSHPVGFAALKNGGGQAEQDADTLLAAVLGERERHLLELHDKLGRVTLRRRILEALGSCPLAPLSPVRRLSLLGT